MKYKIELHLDSNEPLSCRGSLLEQKELQAGWTIVGGVKANSPEDALQQLLEILDRNI